MRIRTIILVLGMLLSIAGCVTTNKTNSAKVGDCVETQVGYVVARCWGTLADVSAEYDAFVLVNVKCDGKLKGTKKNKMVVPLKDLHLFNKSDRCR